MLHKINTETIPEAKEFLMLNMGRYENPPQWVSEIVAKLTFEPFVEIGDSVWDNLRIGNSGLSASSFKGDTSVELQFFPNGSSSPKFAEELGLQRVNFAIFICAMYGLAQWIDKKRFNWEEITMTPNGTLRQIVEKIFPWISDYKHPSAEFLGDYVYTFQYKRLVEYFKSEDFLNSTANKLMERFKSNEEFWPDMINPILFTDIAEGKIYLEV